MSKIMASTLHVTISPYITSNQKDAYILFYITEMISLRTVYIFIYIHIAVILKLVIDYICCVSQKYILILLFVSSISY